MQFSQLHTVCTLLGGLANSARSKKRQQRSPGPGSPSNPTARPPRRGGFAPFPNPPRRRRPPRARRYLLTAASSRPP
jgi:hypothetical protein